jgi:pimeloyl-ACP methyl ester carboxylesterase
MPTFQREPGVELYYEVDDFTDPWTTPETVVMLHGNAEAGLVWFGWVPYLARQFRVIRPDMRGFGRSTVMPADYPWTLDGLVDDVLALLKSQGVERFHLIGAKLGGTLARHFAARCPEQVLTLTVAGTPAPLREKTTSSTPGWEREFIDHGVISWARRTMAGRLGDGFPAEGALWWTELMGRTAVSTQLGFIGTIAVANITDALPKIKCPTLVKAARSARSSRPGHGRRSSPTRSCWYCRATPIMCRPVRRTAVRSKPWHSSTGTAGADGSICCDGRANIPWSARHDSRALADHRRCHRGHRSAFHIRPAFTSASMKHRRSQA